MAKQVLIKNKISIIGAGRVGQSLARALSQKGYTVGGLSCIDLADAQKAASFLGQGFACKKNTEAAGDSEIVFITTPDDAIKGVVDELINSRVDWKGRVVFHCSGVLSSDILSPLSRKGAYIASLHPLQSFPEPRYAEEALRGIFFALEGDKKACEAGEPLVKALGSHVIYIKADAKILYHAAATMASNYLTSLLKVSSEIMGESGISLKQAENALIKLMKGTLANAERLGVHQSLTGPIIRGDEKTILLHLKALREMNPEIERLYRLLGLETLKIAESIGSLSPEETKRIENILQSSD